MPVINPNRSFEEMNADGCQTYDWLWVTVNEAAVAEAARRGLTPYTPKGKAQVVAIVLAVMDRLNEHGVLKIPAHGVKDFIMKTPTTKAKTR